MEKFFDVVWGHWRQEWQTVISAPLIYAMSVAIAAFVVWLIVKAHFAQQINALTATIGHKDSILDEYREKLNGATPFEVAREIVDLKSEVARLQGKLERPQRRLTDEQKEKITTLISELIPQPYFCNISTTPDAESSRYAKQIWSAIKPSVAGCYFNNDGTHDEGESGLILYAPDPPQDEHFLKIADIFRSADVPFDRRVDEQNPSNHYIFVCPQDV